MEIFTKVNGKFTSTKEFGIKNKGDILMFFEFLEPMHYLIFYNLSNNYFTCFHWENLRVLIKIEEKRNKLP